MVGQTIESAVATSAEAIVARLLSEASDVTLAYLSAADGLGATLQPMNSTRV
jgi:hypothetical protein